MRPDDAKAHGDRAPDGGPLPGWGQSASGLWLRLRERAEGCLSGLKQLTGMPDYDGYVRHLRLMHPSWPIPTEREFFTLYVNARYGDGPTRCC